MTNIMTKAFIKDSNRGIWCIKPPMGYDIIRTDGIKKIVVNAVGKKLKKAFEWKAKGMKNDEILQRLQAMGVKIYKQKLSAIFSNPFYCGIIVNKMLEGKIVEGLHEKLIPHELFLRVNEIRIEAKGKYGITHKKEIEETPLKLFAKCDKCQKPLTGYVVKKKGLHYYKCRTVGCKCNKNAKKLNQFFCRTSFGLHLTSTSCITAERDHLYKAGRARNRNAAAGRWS